MNQQEPQQNDVFENAANAMHIGRFVLHAMASTIWIWTRIPGTMGLKQPGFALVVGWIGLAIVASQEPYEGLGLKYIGASAFWLLVHRYRTTFAIERGDGIHSHWVGVSWLTRLGPFACSLRSQEIFELILFAIPGTALCAICEAPRMALWIFVAGFANTLHGGLLEGAEDRRKIQLRDAYVEAMQMQRRARDVFGED